MSGFPAELAYAVEPTLDPAEFVDLLKRSTLADRRPLDDPARVRRMCENSNLIVTARDKKGRLIGLSRSFTDFALCCYLCDLAVDAAHQKDGIGRELIRRTHEASGGDEVLLLLLSAPAAMDYYPKVGFRKLDTAFAIDKRA